MTPEDAYEEENEADSELEHDEEPDFTCGTCGGSGGGPEHWRCQTCLGSGESKWAKRAWIEEHRADDEYDRLRDQGRL